MSTHNRDLKVSEAAKQLRIGSATLFRKLRAAGVFNGKYPREKFVNEGFFRIAHGQYTLPGTQIQNSYAIALVTSKGLNLIREILMREIEKDGAQNRENGNYAISHAYSET